MDFSNLTPEFVTDLIELTSSLTNLPKRGVCKGRTYTFQYVLLDDILAKVKQNTNFAVMTPLGIMEDGRTCVQCVLIHKSGKNLISDQYPIVPYPGQKQCRDEYGNVVNHYKTKQEEGAEITYTRRYALSSFLGIASEEDTDGPPIVQAPPQPAVRPKPAARPSAPQPKPAYTPITPPPAGTPVSKRQRLTSVVKMKLDELDSKSEYDRNYFINLLNEKLNENIRWICSEEGYNEPLCFEAISLLDKWIAQVAGRKKRAEAAAAEEAEFNAKIAAKAENK